MATWKNLEDSELDERIVYVGAYGFSENEAYGHVWAHTHKGFDRMMRSAIRDAQNLCGDEHDRRPYMWYVGPFTTTVGQLIAEDMEERARADEQRDDIRHSGAGYVY